MRSARSTTSSSVFSLLTGTDSPASDAIHRLVWELVERFFGPTSYWGEDGDTTHPIWQAIEDRGETLPAAWVAEIVKNAPAAEAVA